MLISVHRPKVSTTKGMNALVVMKTSDYILGILAFYTIDKRGTNQNLGYKLFQTEISKYVCRLAICKVKVEEISRDNITGAKNTLLLLNLGIILKKGLK